MVTKPPVKRATNEEWYKVFNAWKIILDSQIKDTPNTLTAARWTTIQMNYTPPDIRPYMESAIVPQPYKAFKAFKPILN